MSVMELLFGLAGLRWVVEQECEQFIYIQPTPLVELLECYLDPTSSGTVNLVES